MRCQGAPDDHIIYEIRRNLDGSFSTLEGCKKFLIGACGVDFYERSPGQRLTIYRDPLGHLRQEVKIA